MYNEVVQKVAEKAQTDVTKEKERSLKLIHGAEAIIASKIQSGEIGGINIQGLASLTKAKTELLMPKNINQVNYLKAEGQNLNIEINMLDHLVIYLHFPFIQLIRSRWAKVGPSLPIIPIFTFFSILFVSGDVIVGVEQDRTIDVAEDFHFN